MSLVRAATRIAAVLAIKDRTLAGSRVFDTRFDILPLVEDQKRLPFVVVATDAHDHEKNQVSLLIEFGLLLSIQPEPEDGPQPLTLEQPLAESESELEFLLDVFDRQVQDALRAPETPAADLFATLVPSFTVTSKRFVLPESSVRLAAMQLNLTCSCLQEPQAGHRPLAYMDKLLALMEADPGYQLSVPLLRSFYNRAPDRPQDLIQAAQAQLNRNAAQNLRL